MIMPADTILHRLHAVAAARPEAPAYHHKVDGAWKSTSWGQYVAEVRQATRALVADGFAPGQVVCILGFNRPEWVVLDLAAMAAGGAPAGIYITSSAEEVHYIVHHAEAPVVLVENEGQWEKIRQVRDRLPALKRVVMMRGGGKVDDPMVMEWDAWLARGDTVPDSVVDERMGALAPEQLATLIYTSGTTGPPKGVMLSHENLAWTAGQAVGLVHLDADDINLSYLPLSHIAEQMFTIHAPISSGGQVYFAESMEKMPANLQEVRPTVLFGVPRVWEKFHAKVSAKLADATGLKATLVAWARGVAARVHAARNEGREPGGLDGLQYGVAKRVIFGKLHGAMGLDRVKVMVSGAAPISAEVLEFFATLDLPIREVYGQSEGSGPTSFNAPGNTRFGTVGPAFPGCEVKLGPDQEILLRGPNVFLGYYKDPAATADTLIEGWLHSGDLGSFDDRGFLSIIGRKKEILITSGGKNIAPKNIEAALKDIDIVGEAVVIGDKRRYLAALLTLDPDAVTRLAGELGVPAEQVGDHPKVRERLQAGVDRVNEQVSRVEGVKRFVVLPAPFQPGDELTPTLKVKRKRVNEKYAAVIESMYVE